MAGWIKISREIVNDPMYFAEPFTRIQAWIDLILLAYFEDSYIYIRGNKIPVKRGQVSKSKDFLAMRWKWNKRKVFKFLKDLESEEQITLQNSKLIGLISIVNYDKYQNITLQTTPQSAPQTTLQSTPQSAPPIKNIKKEKNIKKDFGFENRDYIEYNLDDCYNVLSGNSMWRETVVMNTRQSGYRDFDFNKFDEYLKGFFRKLANEGELEKSPKDAMTHFARWLNKELENGSNKTSYQNKQDANDYAMQRVGSYIADAWNSNGEISKGN